MWSIFLYVCWSSVCFLWKKTRIEVLCSYFNCIVNFYIELCGICSLIYIYDIYISSLYVLDINLLSEIFFAKISSHSINCSLVGDAFLCSVKVLYCDWVLFIYFYFCFICLRRQIQKIILRLISKCLLPTFSSMTLMVSGFTCKSLNHVEFIFAYGMRK